jgi:integrase
VADRKPNLLNRALRLAFNARKTGGRSADIAAAIRWVERHSRQVRDLAEPDIFRSLITSLDKKVDGARAAPDTVRLRRTTLTHAIEYAIEKKLLNGNPMRKVKTRKNKTALREVDTRAVVNPTQARTLLTAVASINRRYVAFFASMYFGALRPEEVVNLRKGSLSIPERGWVSFASKRQRRR